MYPRVTRRRNRDGSVAEYRGNFTSPATRRAPARRLPSRLKLRVLTEKYLLRKLGERWLPREIATRPKRPYRAPIHRSFFNESTPEYVHALLSPEAIARAGFFKPVAVGQLVQKIERGMALGETDDMALAGILSTQLVQHHFVDHFELSPPLSEADTVKVCVPA